MAIKTRVGEGTEVHVYLPRDDGVETAGEQTRKPPLVNGSDAAADRVILVVDDDPEVRQVAAEYLERIGFTVRRGRERAKSARNARSRRPDRSAARRFRNA